MREFFKCLGCGLAVATTWYVMDHTVGIYFNLKLIDDYVAIFGASVSSSYIYHIWNT